MATPNGKQNTCESLCMMSVITVAGYDTFHKQRTPMIRFTCQIVSYMNFFDATDLVVSVDRKSVV